MEVVELASNGYIDSMLCLLDGSTGEQRQALRISGNTLSARADLRSIVLTAGSETIRCGGYYAGAPIDIDPGSPERWLDAPHRGHHGFVLRLQSDGTW
jgi:hypothetical protein